MTLREMANGTPVVRRDNAALGEPFRTAEGFLHVDVLVSTPGILLYPEDPNPDGSPCRELVPLETLEDPESLATLVGLALTLDHPPGDVEVTPDNVGQYSVGTTVGEPRREPKGPAIRVAVQRRDALDALASGVRSASAGYRALSFKESGVHPEFGAYDRVQRHRRYNHIAIVPKGRAGPQVVFRLDGAPMLTPEEITALAKAIAAELKTAMAPAVKQDEAPAAVAEVPPAEQVARKDAAGLAYHVARKPLEARAVEYGVENIDELSNAALEKELVLKANPRFRKDSSPAEFSAAAAMVPERAKEGGGTQARSENKWPELKDNR